MSSDPPAALRPVMVIEDRYGGSYSRGRWWAVARKDDLLQGVPRVTWLMENGPGSEDVACSIFWSEPPPWGAVGGTPAEAVAALQRQDGADTGDWMPPR